MKKPKRDSIFLWRIWKSSSSLHLQRTLKGSSHLHLWRPLRVLHRWRNKKMTWWRTSKGSSWVKNGRTLNGSSPSCQESKMVLHNKRPNTINIRLLANMPAESSGENDELLNRGCGFSAPWHRECFCFNTPIKAESVYSSGRVSPRTSPKRVYLEHLKVPAGRWAEEPFKVLS